MNNFIEKTTGFNTIMRNVYLWMTFALILTGITAFYISNTEYVFTLIYNKFFLIFIIIAELALVISISSFINKLSFK